MSFNSQIMYETNKNEADIYNPRMSKDIQLSGADSKYEYICKKAERISSAIYLITEHIKDTDPLKSLARNKAMAIIFSASSFNYTSFTEGDLALSKIKAILWETKSIAGVAYNVGLISEANYLILSQGIRDLLMEVNNFYYGKSENHVSEDFFSVPKTVNLISKPEPSNRMASPDFITEQKTKSYKRQNLTQGTTGSNQQRDSIKDNKIHPSSSDKKKVRRDSVISVLNKNQGIDIKGFSLAISDCSEKTIQRELTLMLNEGLIRKEGERRWSRYYHK